MSRLSRGLSSVAFVAARRFGARVVGSHASPRLHASRAASKVGTVLARTALVGSGSVALAVSLVSFEAQASSLDDGSSDCAWGNCSRSRANWGARSWHAGQRSRRHLSRRSSRRSASRRRGDSLSCRRDRDCGDRNARTLDWCDDAGQCQNTPRDQASCQAAGMSWCYQDRHCRDGDPSTLDWCYGMQCHHAARDEGGSCEAARHKDHGGGADEDQCDDSCTEDRDCKDGSRRTIDWCHEGTCIHIDRKDPECRDEDQECCKDWECDDDDASTIDWCYRGHCSHAGRDDGGTCEPCDPTPPPPPPTECDVAECPEDGNPCTFPVCEDDTCGQFQRPDGFRCEEGKTCQDGECLPPVQPPECQTHEDCQDGVFCNGTEQCVNNQCSAGTPFNCETRLCEVGTCSEQVQRCVFDALPNGTVCSVEPTRICDVGECVFPAQAPDFVEISHQDRGSIHNPRWHGSHEWKAAGGYEIRAATTHEQENVALTHQFHSFDVSGVRRRIIGASIQLPSTGMNFHSPNSHEIFALHDVDEARCDNLFLSSKSSAPGDWSQLFEDLGDGPEFARGTVHPGDQGNFIHLQFNTDGLAALNDAAAGSGRFVVGGAIKTGDLNGNWIQERIFCDTGDVAPTKLLLTLAP